MSDQGISIHYKLHTQITNGSLMPRIANAFREQLSNVNLMFAIRRERRQLSEVPDYLLKDVGLSWSEVRAESSRHFWDVPVSRTGV